MFDAHEFLRSLTVVLGVAAITTVVFQRLRQPVVLGYIMAGLIVGPHVPIPVVADKATVQTLSELGVILLMFSLGLEFSLGKLVRVGPVAGFTAVFQCGVMAWLGFLVGRLFGWTPLESVFAGAAMAISSTTIIAKVFEERGITGRLRELVVGILLIEDLIAIVFMAALTAVATGAGLSAGALTGTLGRLAAFLAVLLVIGILVIPRFIRYVDRVGRSETMLIASIGVCFAMAYVAGEFGYSVALGAFLAGSLVAESGLAEKVEDLVRPVRDVFAAVFFVSVGMLIDPALVARNGGAVAVFVILVIVGKVVSVTLGAFLSGAGLRTAIQSGMSLAQIGEFSFIITALGLSLGATRDFLYPVAVAVSAVTTLTTPWLIRASEPVATLVDRKMPRPLQTFVTLYGAWLERLRARPDKEAPAGLSRIIMLLCLDTLLLIALIIGTGVGLDRMAAGIGGAAGTGPAASRTLVIGSAFALSIPLILGIGRLSNRLVNTIAAGALPRRSGTLDLDAPPRQALVVTLQLGVALVVGVLVLAVTQPFLPGYVGVILLPVLVLGFGVAIWRSAANLESHVRAGAEAMLESLTRYARAGSASEGDGPVLEIGKLVAGLGEPVAVQLDRTSPGAGRTLRELNLRGRTGATILAISRGSEAVAAPSAGERLREGDVVALIGTSEAIRSARVLLLGEAEP
ncbi:MAG: cation:proton antiporter [Candidatus Polarisedimenticolia bacterium]